MALRRIRLPLAILSALLTVLTPLAVLGTVYLYLYPVFHGCGFPVPGGNGFTRTLRSHLPFTSVPETQAAEAPFRLLVLADPQLEGDSSLPSAGFLERLGWVFDGDVYGDDEDVGVVQKTRERGRALLAELGRSAQVARKMLDLLGNDYYLAHVFRTMHWWSRPSHVTVLGDLIGSQWVSDREFDIRGERYWQRVFRGGEIVSQDDLSASSSASASGSRTGTGVGDWSRKIINIAGNHDIGYAGDISEARLERFERVFGPANWDVNFYPDTGNSERGIHMINLNSLTLDSPALSSSIQTHSYEYINDVLTRSPPVEDRNSFTLLLTHLPLHKESGICVDGPYIAYHGSDDHDGRFEEGGLREQNHLSEGLSASGILQGIFGMSGDVNSAAGGIGRNGLILNGHDHEGCDIVHYIAQSSESVENGTENGDGDEGGETWTWKAARYNGTMPERPSIREVTLRSMMGEFGGNAGLLSVWFEGDDGEWKYEIQMCAAGVQHIWWAVHVVDIVVLVGWLGFVLLGGKRATKQSVSQPAGKAGKQSEKETGQKSGIQPEKAKKEKQ